MRAQPLLIALVHGLHALQRSSLENAGIVTTHSPLERRSLGGRPFAPLRLDYGSTYASKFERLKGDRVIINTVRGRGRCDGLFRCAHGSTWSGTHASCSFRLITPAPLDAVGDGELQGLRRQLQRSYRRGQRIRAKVRTKCATASCTATARPACQLSALAVHSPTSCCLPHR